MHKHMAFNYKWPQAQPIKQEQQKTSIMTFRWTNTAPCDDVTHTPSIPVVVRVYSHGNLECVSRQIYSHLHIIARHRHCHVEKFARIFHTCTQRTRHIQCWLKSSSSLLGRTNGQLYLLNSQVFNCEYILFLAPVTN